MREIHIFQRVEIAKPGQFPFRAKRGKGIFPFQVNEQVLQCCMGFIYILYVAPVFEILDIFPYKYGIAFIHGHIAGQFIGGPDPDADIDLLPQAFFILHEIGPEIMSMGIGRKLFQ
ncbi:hypothetical protein RAA17_12895 [Komagataeibacter rhaeticus]|nr:hypothetical protein [Komagataeibacter rhaeticus]